MRLTHLGSSSPVSVHFVFVRAQSSSFAGVVSWALVIHACVGVVIIHVVVCGRGCCPWGGVAVAVLGAVLSFVGSASSFVGGVRSRAVYVIRGWGADVRGWGADVRGLWLSYMRGVGAVVGH